MVRYPIQQKNLKSAVPRIFLYDKDGGQQILGTGIFHTWDTIETMTSDFTYIADGNKIYCGKTINGLYKITFNCSYKNSGEGSGSDYVITNIWKNGVAVTGSTVSDTAIAAIPTERLQQGLDFYIYLKNGDYIQIYSYTPNLNSTFYTYEDSSRLSIEFIPMKGWNNSSGGKEVYSGGVSR